MATVLLAIEPLFLIGPPLFLNGFYILLGKGARLLVFFPFFLLLLQKYLLK